MVGLLPGESMKRCPTCNQTFTDEWLTFCTQDGTALVNAESSQNEPPPTVVYPAPMPPSVSPSEQPTLDLPGGHRSPPALYSPPQSPQAWMPPPSPAFGGAAPQKTVAIASLVLGIVSVTLGWCCFFGVLTSPVAIGLGIFALVQINKDPTKYGGRPLAIGGIVAGSLFLVLTILIQGFSFLAHGLR